MQRSDDLTRTGVNIDVPLKDFKDMLGQSVSQRFRSEQLMNTISSLDGPLNQSIKISIFSFTSSTFKHKREFAKLI